MTVMSQMCEVTEISIFMNLLAIGAKLGGNNTFALYVNCPYFLTDLNHSLIVCSEYSKLTERWTFVKSSAI